MSIESTYIMIKPEGVQRGLVGKIIQRFEEKGFVLKRITSKVPSKEVVEEHYDHLKDKPFFSGMVSKLSSGLVICMEWEGYKVVEGSRTLIGATNPLEAMPGSIRGDYGSNLDNNVVHGSDSVENAQKELKLWFK